MLHKYNVLVYPLDDKPLRGRFQKEEMMRKLVMAIIGSGLILISQNANADSVLLDDNFNSENGGDPFYPNYANFQNWDVVSSGVDLCGPEYYSYHGMPSWVGLYVETLGGCMIQPATLLKAVF
jgi:hypothetical protein